MTANKAAPFVNKEDISKLVAEGLASSGAVTRAALVTMASIAERIRAEREAETGRADRAEKERDSYRTLCRMRWWGEGNHLEQIDAAAKRIREGK